MKRNIGHEMQSVRQGLKCSTIEGILSMVHFVLTQGVILTYFVLDLGSSNFICGVVAALPFLLQFSYLLSPVLVRRLRNRKSVAVWFTLLHRMAWLVLIALLYVDWAPWIKQAIMLFTLVVSNACAVIAGNAWYSWMADLVPVSIRGSYYGRRNAYLGLTSMSVLFIGTQVLDYFREYELGHIGYTVCFLAAIASAAFGVKTLHKQYEPQANDIPQMSLKKLYRLIVDNHLLRDYVCFTILWQLSMGIAAAFAGVFMVRILNMSPAQMGYQALIASVAALVGSRLWGKTLDNVGERTVLLASATIIFSQAMLWLVAMENFLWPIWILSVTSGFSWAGFGIVSFSWPQKMCGKTTQQHTFGMLGLLSGPGFAVGSLLGGVITTVLPEIIFVTGAIKITHFHVVFALSILGRMLAVKMMARRSLEYDKYHRSIWRSINDSFLDMYRNLRYPQSKNSLRRQRQV